jgi:hypothetical protein
MGVEELIMQVKEILSHPCDCGNEHLRCELATDEQSCRVWCEICGWDITVHELAAAVVIPIIPRKSIVLPDLDVANFIGKWITDRRGTNWELDKLVTELRGMMK